jgi:hypothetical protein
VILPEALGKNLVDQIVGIVLVHLDLFQNDAALAQDVFIVEDRVQNQVGENVERSGDMLIENLEIEADGFFARECVQVSTDGVDFARDILRRARLRALEDHVFDKMRDAIHFRQLMPRASPDPHTHGDRPDVLHALGQDD